MPGIGIDLEYLYERTSTVRLPEHDLFLAVILQAFDDLRKTVWRKPQLEAEAREWLLSGGAEFQRVCAFASVDPDFIQYIARRYIEHLDAGGKAKRIVILGNETQGNPPWLVSPHQI
jgi:hypothetical protein